MSPSALFMQIKNIDKREVVIIATFKASSPSDMKRLMKALEKDAKASIKSQAIKAKYDIECPKCHAEISLKPGNGICPKCGEEINLNLKFDF